MEDRIEINGVWYVREDRGTTTKAEGEFEKVTFSKEALLETDSLVLELTWLEYNGEYDPDDIMLQITFKKEDKRTELWDNADFLKGLRRRDTKSLSIAKEELDEEGMRALLYLIDNCGWF